jgi:hypothetical protein
MEQKNQAVLERRIEDKTNRKFILTIVLVLSITLTTFSILLLWNHNRIQYLNESTSESALKLDQGENGLNTVEPISKTLRTVVQSEERNVQNLEHAISFRPEMDRIKPQKFKHSDKDIVPGRYLSSSESVDTTEFKTFTILPKSTQCDTTKLLITIKSATDHFEHRMAVRESWSTVEIENVEIVFLLGQSGSEQINNAIQQEANDFDDIVQGDYRDTYSNLTLKALNGLEYRKTICFQPEYILAIDDDTYVNLEALKAHLARLDDSTDFIECSERTVVKGKVWRQGRWAVDPETYPNEKYPTYCNGPCYLMPRSTANQLYNQTLTTHHDLQADDALITGIYRVKSEIPLIQYTRTGSPGWCHELNNRKPRLPQRMRREFERNR